MRLTPLSISLACGALLTLAIGGCSAVPGVAAPLPLRTLAAASGCGVNPASPAPPPPADQVSAPDRAQYAKGFRDGYTDRTRADQASDERQEYLKLRAKYGAEYASAPTPAPSPKAP